MIEIVVDDRERNSGVIEVVGDVSWPGMGGAGAYGGIGVNSGGGAGSVAKVPTIDVYDGNWHHVVVQWQDPDGVPSDVALNTGADATIYIDNQLAGDVNTQTYNGNSGQASPTMEQNTIGGLISIDGPDSAQIHDNHFVAGAAVGMSAGGSTVVEGNEFDDGAITADSGADPIIRGNTIPPPIRSHAAFTAAFARVVPCSFAA